jgi:hypothetical protein
MKRDDFREAVFKRDNHKCVICGEQAQDAHHIMERRLFTDGGYHPDNGASVCGPCHLNAERTIISPEELREAAGITNVYLPQHMYPDQRYDKWGNIILSEERRLPGELFHDPSVQKVLAQVLPLFTHWVKYPRTHHLPWSPGMHGDDRVIDNLSALEGSDVVVTLKMDGENTSMYSDHIHARSVTSESHPARDWVKNLWSRIAHDIPTGWRICGENLWAKHSIGYEDLDSFFLGFSVWNDKNICLSWGETLEWFELFNIHHVPVIYNGPFDQKTIQSVFDNNYPVSDNEGYVVRVSHDFPYSSFRRSVAKWVRPNHVQTTKHWFRGQRVEQNNLKE